MTAALAADRHRRRHRRRNDGRRHRADRRASRPPRSSCTTRASAPPTRPRRDIADALGKLVAKGKLAAADAEAALNRIATVVTLPDACVVSLVVEAIVEDLTAKRDLFARLENVVAPECILASNTSSLSITALGTGLAASGARRRHAFLQPGAADAAGRSRVRARDRSGRGGDHSRHCRRLGQDAGPCGVDAGLHRQPLRAAVLRRSAAPARRAGGGAGDDRRGHARSRRFPDGSVRAHGPDRPRRELRGDAERVGSVLPRSALYAVGAAARAGRRGFSRPQVRTRVLRLRARRGHAGAADRGPGPAARARRRPWRTGRRRAARRAVRGRGCRRRSRRGRMPGSADARCTLPGPAGDVWLVRLGRPHARPRGRRKPACAISSCSILRSITPRRRDSRLRAPTAAPTPPAPRPRARCRWRDSR